MRFLDIIQGQLIVPQLRAANKWDAIEELVDQLVEAHEIRILDRREVLEAVLARERSQSTGLDRRIALPHARTRAIEDVVGVLGIAPEGIPFESTDGQAAQLVCLLVFPEGQLRDHIRILSDVARALSDASFRAELVAAGASGEPDRVVGIIEHAEGLRFFELDE